MYYIYEGCTGEIFITKHSMENLQCDICGDWNEFWGNFPVRSNFERIKENYKEIKKDKEVNIKNKDKEKLKKIIKETIKKGSWLWKQQ